MNDILMLLKGVEFGLVKKRLVRVFFLSIFVLHHHDLTTDLLIWKTNFEWSKVSETEYEKVLCTMMRITASTGNFQTVGKRKFEHQMITLLQHPPSIPSAEYEHSKTTVPVNAMGAQIQIYVNTPSAPFSNMPDILCNVWTIMDPPHLPNHVHTTQSISPPVTSNPFTGSEYPLSFLRRKLNKVYIFS